MIENNIEKTPRFPIETIEVLGLGEVSYSPLRGNIITGLNLNGVDILYFDEETFYNSEKNVKGGIPILFPNSGPLENNSQFPDLKQHGFARILKWISEKIKNGFKGVLVSNEETNKLYPYDFKFYVSGKFEEDGSFTMSQEVENLEESKEMPISMGLHPYFKVPHDEKGNIKFNFEGGNLIEEQVEIWSNDGTISIDNPKIKNPNAVVEVYIPKLGKLFINASIHYKKILVWSLPGKDFVCIEPVMRDDGGLIKDPEMIKPGETFKATVNFKLEK